MIDQNGNTHLTLSVTEYWKLSPDAHAKASTITVILADGSQVTVKNRWGAQAALPVGAK